MLVGSIDHSGWLVRDFSFSICISLSAISGLPNSPDYASINVASLAIAIGQRPNICRWDCAFITLIDDVIF